MTSRGSECYIQASYLLASNDIINRELNAYSSIHDSYPEYVLSLDRIELSRNGIKHINIQDFT